MFGQAGLDGLINPLRQKDTRSAGSAKPRDAGGLEYEDGDIDGDDDVDIAGLAALLGNYGESC
ncbi:MAG: hypothetical protein KKI02_11845 [Planctomycetes bacterium]|nr:hypothetical protein [Planctomycetota bacterium]